MPGGSSRRSIMKSILNTTLDRTSCLLTSWKSQFNLGVNRRSCVRDPRLLWMKLKHHFITVLLLLTWSVPLPYLALSHWYEWWQIVHTLFCTSAHMSANMRHSLYSKHSHVWSIKMCLNKDLISHQCLITKIVIDSNLSSTSYTVVKNESFVPQM